MDPDSWQRYFGLNFPGHDTVDVTDLLLFRLGKTSVAGIVYQTTPGRGDAPVARAGCELATQMMPLPFSLLPVVTDCNQLWLVVALRYTRSVPEDTLHRVCNSDAVLHAVFQLCLP